MSLIEQLENLGSEMAQVERWNGTFRQFLELYKSKKYKNLGILSHKRINNMISSKGTEKVGFFGQERTKYNFFEDYLFGLEKSIDELMAYISSAAQRTETSRRMLLLWGPPSSGKSQIAILLKRGLEEFSKTDAGATFAIKESPINENPFLLIPHSMREQFEKEYGLQIEGTLCPKTAKVLETKYKGNFMEVPIHRMFFSEAQRVGIGTWLPGDVKSQDVSELIGGIDFARIQEVGQESDPDAYNFDGELFVSNRGIMEFIEGLRADEKFLRACLTATQEKCVKAPRFGLIYVDEFILMHSNETQVEEFLSDKKFEAYHDRTVIIKVPYNLSVSNEVKIYEKLLNGTDAIVNMHIAPQTLEVAAMISVLSRLSDPKDGELSIVKKMKLYDGKYVKGFKLEQVPDIRKRDKNDGMFGISPRFVIDQISASISRARDEGRDYVTPLDILRQLNKSILDRDSFSQEEKNRYISLIEIGREEWNDILKNDIQKAFFLSYDDEARNLCENYLEHIEASLSDTKPRDPVTGDEIEINEKLMDAVESHMKISSSGKHDFRLEIQRFIASTSRKNVKFDYTQHTQLKEGIQKTMFEERSPVIRMTVSSRNPDPEALRRLNEVIDRMCEQQSYSPKAANELLKYASAHLFEK